MGMIKEGFKIHYEILVADSMKSRDAGIVEGTPYPKALTVRSEVLETQDNVTFGMDDVESILYFVFPATTDEEVIHLKEYLRSLTSKKETFSFVGTRPFFKKDKGRYEVKCLNSIEELLKMHNYALPKSVEKASQIKA
ncbi:MAG: hypothetical protein PHX13_12520 [Thiovulaceae bacterium]|nr:hypothetical protein [Sulfurimonadaceae bacterium]